VLLYNNDKIKFMSVALDVCSGQISMVPRCYLSNV
jgi:hypothetical protein